MIFDYMVFCIYVSSVGLLIVVTERFANGRWQDERCVLMNKCSKEKKNSPHGQKYSNVSYKNIYITHREWYGERERESFGMTNYDDNDQRVFFLFIHSNPMFGIPLNNNIVIFEFDLVFVCDFFIISFFFFCATLFGNRYFSPTWGRE